MLVTERLVNPGKPAKIDHAFSEFIAILFKNCESHLKAIPRINKIGVIDSLKDLLLTV
jgi:hypothetical protein